MTLTYIECLNGVVSAERISLQMKSAKKIFAKLGLYMTVWHSFKLLFMYWL